MLGEGFIVDSKKARCERMRSSVTGAAKLHEEEAAYQSRRLGRSAYRKTFITLTYRPGEKWEPRHISEFIKACREWMQRRRVRCMYVWVGELQKRGALHYHVLLWVPRRLRLPKPDRCGWWPHGMSNIETARNPVGYMVKYATKTRPRDLKRLPKGVRLHGNGGHTPTNRVRLRETLAPWWMRKAWDQHVLAGVCADLEAQQAWETRRVERRHHQVDGTMWVSYHDPDGPPEGSDAWWQAYAAEQERRAEEEASWVAYAAKYGPKGCPRFRRVSGGFVDLRTGELFETPYRVMVAQGVVTVVPKVETVQ